MTRLYSLPFIVVLMGIAAVSMLLPAGFAFFTRDYDTSRAFFYASLLLVVFVTILGLTTQNMRIRRQGRSHLISIFATFTIVPILLAVPFAEAVPDTRFFNAYFEMVSSLTTTGMTLFPAERLPDAVHLWRAQVAWMGGFFIWVIAIAVFAPLTLGGFEMSSAGEIGQGARHTGNAADPSARLRRFAVKLFPIYAGLTGGLWAALVVAGDGPLVGLIHAMSVLSTSGISGTDGFAARPSGGIGEIIILVFFIFALSRLTFLSEERVTGIKDLTTDPELRIGLALVGSLAVFLFARHWMVSFDDADLAIIDVLQAFWGTLFTALSFLTTTGFESLYWDFARDWSGIGAPGVLLLGLAVIGGGVATTAGGVKLLRCYALSKHGFREMEKLVQPSSVGRSGRFGRTFRRQGANAAWVFFMLFALSIALIMAALSITGGVGFEDGVILTVAALSTTGPLVEVAATSEIDLIGLSDPARLILCAAMVIGRLEAIAIIALMNPEFWR